MQRVAGRTAAPLLFFFVFMTIFAAIMYVFEVAVCFPGEIDDGAGSTTCGG